MDAAGVVRSAPPGSGFEAGQRVAVLAAYGCWQDVITADPSWTLPLPDDMGFEAGAAAPLNYLTSLFALVRRGHAQPGRCCWCTAPPACRGGRDPGGACARAHDHCGHLR
jgi:NADPH2:quinone reductase